MPLPSTILIVEDDPKIAQLLQSHLEKYSYTAVPLTDFAHVFDEFQAHTTRSCVARY